ncbi:hypothetical protein PVK06_026867 [Gossypium arboreum]|uniref:Uncharacterized protein n=1 Tax=Gossypium arboreum TaxID=29729 RepID=A0ABR0P1A5_GOSAR|nr:hypothetical protein PVK06_026867 [Gossypium arboreum]
MFSEDLNFMCLNRFYYFSLEELPMSLTFLISFSQEFHYHSFIISSDCEDVFSSIQSETIMQKSCRAFSSGDVGQPKVSGQELLDQRQYVKIEIINVMSDFLVPSKSLVILHWKLKPRVKVMIDVVSSGINEVREAWESQRKSFTSEFFEADPCTDNLETLLQEKDIQADLVCCLQHLQEKPTTLDCGPRTICRRHIMTSSYLYKCLWEALQQRIRMILINMQLTPYVL